MTLERVRAVTAAGDSLDLEFKEKERTPLPDEERSEALVCPANHSSSIPAWPLVGGGGDGRETGVWARLLPPGVEGGIGASRPESLKRKRADAMRAELKASTARHRPWQT
jgi:hypothetical protein